jgi:hypothetical protein
VKKSSGEKEKISLAFFKIRDERSRKDNIIMDVIKQQQQRQ